MSADRLLNQLRLLFPSEDTGGWDLLDFVYAYGSPIHALLYFHLFWPDITEIDGMVFLTSSMSSEDDFRRLREAIIRLNGNKQLVEKSFNFFDVANLFANQESADDSDYLRLAECLKETWTWRLWSAYPDRNFVVEVIDDEEDIGVIFYQT